VLTRRVAYRVERGAALAKHVLVLTFTRRAAAELTSRLHDLGIREGVAAGTFHAIAYAQLRRRWADRGRRAPALLERKVSLLRALLPRGGDRPLEPADVAAEIEWAKARMVSPGRYEAAAREAGRRPPLPAPVMATVYQRYEDEKRSRAVIDFDDIVLLCGRALRDDSEFAAAQRWRFRHLFVDEFQDVNPAQLRLLEGWRGESSDLCVVGDPDQAIYGWNGADARPLIEFTERHAGASVVRLEHNYRSSPQVVTVADAVLGRGPGAVTAGRPDGDPPSLTSYPTDGEEARAVAGLLRRRRGGRRWCDHAVLARTNGQLVVMEEALRAAKIPVRVRGSVSFLERPEVKDFLARLRSGADDKPLTAVLPDLDEQASEAASAGGGAPDERADALLSLRRLAAEQLSIDPSAMFSGFEPWLRAALGDGAEAGGDAVELATFHAAKGLEWPVVFVVGLEAGFVPIGHAETAEARSEEKRLLYVAVTRAEEELHCSWAQRRTFGARAVPRSPSPWVEAIEAAIEATRQRTAAGQVDWRRHLRHTRSRLAAVERPKAGSRADPVLLESLKQWRASAARAAGVPAYVLMHDTTLAAIAEARPADTAELLGVPGVGPVKSERYGQALLEVVESARGGRVAPIGEGVPPERSEGGGTRSVTGPGRRVGAGRRARSSRPPQSIDPLPVIR
jgi:DNA helicase-2/ATP-dependent DNA helicase PcrA